MVGMNLFVPVIESLLCNLTSELLQTALENPWRRNQSFLLQKLAWSDITRLSSGVFLFQGETGADGRRDKPQRGRKIRRITSGTLQAPVRYPYPLPASS